MKKSLVVWLFTILKAGLRSIWFRSWKVKVAVKNKLAVLFADVSGSTTLYEQIGDEEARGMVAECHAAMQTIVDANVGTVVKEIGDELMCRFSNMEDAATTANNIHRMMQLKRFGNGVLRMRIGIHFGPVLDEQDDIHGDTVNVAARMVAQAKSEQTVLSSAAWESLPETMQRQCALLDVVPLKGKKDDMRIYTLMWLPRKGTRVARQEEQITKVRTVRLSVRYKSFTSVIDSRVTSLTIGREEDCDLRIDGEHVSRHHLHMQLRRNKIYIVDDSTNGTYVRSGGREIFLRRETMPVFGDGALSLGQPFSDDLTNHVLFHEERSSRS